jgi:hypothetical protein
MKLLASVFLVLISMLPVAAGSQGESAPASGDADRGKVDEYWVGGEAEITRYDLLQARLGELREGDAVLLFEVRHFLPEKRAEADAPDWQKVGGIEVLRLNFTKEFTAGVNPYAIMTSVYTPLRISDHPRTLATATSVQQWPGQASLQLDLTGDVYEVTGRSYLDTGANEARELEATWLEDEIWTRIRLAPSTLPTGMVQLIPGGEQARLRNRPLSVETARVSLEERGEGVMVYAIRYRALNRKLAISFEKAFPHSILGWEEWYGDAAGASGRNQTTKATRAESIRLDYRNLNGVEDVEWRAKLGLD